MDSAQLAQINPDQLRQIAADCTCFNLRKATRAVTQFYDQALEPSGLLVTQFTILVAIALSQPVLINELAQALAMDRTTLTRNLKPLKREEWISIEPGQDQRTRLVRLTEGGQVILTRATPLWQQAQAAVVEKLGSDHWAMLLTHLSETTQGIKAL